MLLILLIVRLGQEAYSVSIPILDSVSNSPSWKYLFTLFIIVLLCIGLLLSSFLSHWGVHNLVSFRFSSNVTYRDCVSKDGVELVQNSVYIETFDLLKDKLFLEDFGVLLVCTADTEDFKVFTSTEFDSIVLRKNDGSILGKLLFTGGKLQFI